MSYFCFYTYKAIRKVLFSPILTKRSYKGLIFVPKLKFNKLRCCEFKGKQASKIESTSLFCISYTVLHVRDQKNEWSVFVE